MTTARTPRPRASRVAQTEPPLTTLFAPDLLVRMRSWEGATASARLEAADLAAGRFPPMPLGSVHQLTPALSFTEFGPVPEHSEYFSDCDPIGDWWGDGAGSFCCRGALIPPSGWSPSAMLDVVGRAFQIVGRNLGLDRLNAIEARGLVRLDPRMGPGGDLEPQVERWRDEWRVTALRRYPVTDGEPREPEALDRLPEPGEVEVGALYAVDLVGGPDR